VISQVLRYPNPANFFRNEPQPISGHLPPVALVVLPEGKAPNQAKRGVNLQVLFTRFDFKPVPGFRFFLIQAVIPSPDLF
jgi:hypothetical protein